MKDVPFGWNSEYKQRSEKLTGDRTVANIYSAFAACQMCQTLSQATSLTPMSKFIYLQAPFKLKTAEQQGH